MIVQSPYPYLREDCKNVSNFTNKNSFNNFCSGMFACSLSRKFSRCKKNEVRIMEIYKEMEYPPGTQVEKHKLEKREERRWIVVNCRSSLPPQDVIAFYDRLFLYRGGEKHLSETHRKIEYDYYIEDYIVVISSLEKGTFRISIHLKRF